MRKQLRALNQIDIELKEILLGKSTLARLNSCESTVSRHEEENAIYVKESSKVPGEKVGDIRI